jgi:hypothetical protein
MGLSKTTHTVALEDGSFHVICDLSSFNRSPHWKPEHCIVTATITKEKKLVVPEEGAMWLQYLGKRDRFKAANILYARLETLWTGRRWGIGKSLTREQSVELRKEYDKREREHAVRQPNNFKRKYGREKLMQRLHNTFWRQIEPLLDQEALRLTRSVRQDLKFYNKLVENRYFRELIKTSRLIAWFPTQDIKQGERFHDFLMRAVLEDGVIDRVQVNPNVNRLSPGFIKWAKKAHFTPAFCGSPIRGTLNGMFQLRDKIDPNRLDQLKGQRAWYTLHQIAFIHCGLIPAFLANPDGALKALEAFLPPDVAERYTCYRDRLSAILNQILDTQHDWELKERNPHFYDLSFVRILEETREYHRDIMARQAEQRRIRMEKDKELMSRPFPEPPFKEVITDKYRLVWLKNGEELDKEGNAMSHCVGGYVRQCVAGSSTIFGIRTPDNKRIATLELDSEFKVRQLYAKTQSASR